MRIKIIVISFMILSFACHAEDGSWSHGIKKSAEKVLGSSKKAAGIGLDKTTNFINKTAQATKEGFKAFAKSYDENKSKETDVTVRKAFPPPYLSIQGYKFCLAIKRSPSKEIFCLPINRPMLCKEQIFKQLNSLNSPKAC